MLDKHVVVIPTPLLLVAINLKESCNDDERNKGQHGQEHRENPSRTPRRSSIFRSETNRCQGVSNEAENCKCWCERQAKPDPAPARFRSMFVGVVCGKRTTQQEQQCCGDAAEQHGPRTQHHVTEILTFAKRLHERGAISICRLIYPHLAFENRVQEFRFAPTEPTHPMANNMRAKSFVRCHSEQSAIVSHKRVLSSQPGNR
mmetsp:Transcript_93830/g.201466  ORF Transcript_93830/g.201466 Transcript_93830/m.201466 type:complete len:202 (-) Transcript_93830:171-776(-)